MIDLKDLKRMEKYRLSIKAPVGGGREEEVSQRSFLLGSRSIFDALKPDPDLYHRMFVVDTLQSLFKKSLIALPTLKAMHDRLSKEPNSTENAEILRSLSELIGSSSVSHESSSPSQEASQT